MKKAKLILLAGLAMAVSLTGCQKKEVKPGDVAGYDEGEQYLSIWVHSIEDTPEGQVYRESVDLSLIHILCIRDRWYGSTLSDPDNFKNKTADVILQELFGF